VLKVSTFALQGNQIVCTASHSEGVSIFVS